MNHTRPLALMVAALLVVGACSGGGDDGSSGDAATTVATTTQAPTTTTQAPTTTTPPGMSDEEFAVAAVSICETLLAELDATAETIDFSAFRWARGPVFDRAAAEMRALDFTEESAPGAAALVASLDQTADGWDEFDVALADSLAALDSPLDHLLVTEEGNVYLITEGENLVEAEIDPAVVMAPYDAEDALVEAATSLGLTACVPPPDV